MKRHNLFLAGIGSFHPAVDMEAVGRYGDAALDKLFEQGPNRARAIRADVGDEVEGGIGHGVSLSAHGSAPKAEAGYTRPRAGPLGLVGGDAEPEVDERDRCQRATSCGRTSRRGNATPDGRTTFQARAETALATPSAAVHHKRSATTVSRRWSSELNTSGEKGSAFLAAIISSGRMWMAWRRGAISNSTATRRNCSIARAPPTLP